MRCESSSLTSINLIFLTIIFFMLDIIDTCEFNCLVILVIQNVLVFLNKKSLSFLTLKCLRANNRGIQIIKVWYIMCRVDMNSEKTYALISIQRKLL